METDVQSNPCLHKSWVWLTWFPPRTPYLPFEQPEPSIRIIHKVCNQRYNEPATIPVIKMASKLHQSHPTCWGWVTHPPNMDPVCVPFPHQIYKTAHDTVIYCTPGLGDFCSSFSKKNIGSIQLNNCTSIKTYACVMGLPHPISSNCTCSTPSPNLLERAGRNLRRDLGVHMGEGEAGKNLVTEGEVIPLVQRPT